MLSIAPDARDDRGRCHRTAGFGLVVEAHVAGHVRRSEAARRVAEPVDRRDHRAQMFRHGWIAEVQAIRETEWARTNGDDIAHRFEHSVLGRELRIALAVARIPRNRKRDADRCAGNRHDHAGIGNARRHRGRAAHDAVVSFEDTTPRAHITVRQQRIERGTGIGEAWPIRARRRHIRQCDRIRAVIAHAAREKAEIDIHHDLALVARNVARPPPSLCPRSPRRRRAKYAARKTLRCRSQAATA